MVLGLEPSAEIAATTYPIGEATSLPNVFMVGDTIIPTATMAAVVDSAFALANKLTSSLK